jgi:hypothetical protein
MLHLLYFVHDLADPAVRRRVLMLQAGGARVTLAGFRRSENSLAEVSGVMPIELGRTADAQFTQRIGAVAKAAFSLARRLAPVERPDVVIARNLEMLAIANRANSIFGGDVPIVYECLDVHRLLLSRGAAGKAIRAAERRFGRKARLLLTSSPAFVENYFEKLSGVDLPVFLLENKVAAFDTAVLPAMPAPRVPTTGEPWKIGWFGALRCRKSLNLLADFSRKMNGRVEIVLRGRPAYSEFDDFDAFVRNEPFMTFHGPYRNPEDLAAIYNEVQFSWAIDFFEEGQNSDWLLPNRLYEGCLYGAVPVAMQGTETARMLAAMEIGLSLPEPSAEGLCTLFDGMEGRYPELFRAVLAQDRNRWVANRSDAVALVDRLASLTAPPTVLRFPSRPPLPASQRGELL